jgi:hypothetical protein
MSLEHVDFGDVIFVERQEDVRIIVSIPARFSSSERRDARGERRVFDCRAVYLSPGAVALASPVSVSVGERIIAHIDRVGELTGVVAHVLEGGFVMSIAAGADQRNQLATKIQWLEKYKNHDVLDRRADERVMASSPHSRVILPDGSSSCGRLRANRARPHSGGRTCHGVVWSQSPLLGKYKKSQINAAISAFEPERIVMKAAGFSPRRLHRRPLPEHITGTTSGPTGSPGWRSTVPRFPAAVVSARSAGWRFPGSGRLARGCWRRSAGC